MEINEQVKTIAPAIMGRNEEEEVERKEPENKGSTKKKERTRIALEEFSKFENTIESKLDSTRKMGREINSLFKPTINGYRGCKFRFKTNGTADFNNPFELKIFIEYLKDEDLDKNKITVIKKVAVDNTTNAIEKINILNNYTVKHKMYALTDEGKEVLEDYVKREPNKEIKWDDITSEVADTSIMGAGSIYYMAIDVDLIKMLKHIYGFKTPEGNWYEYSVMACRPIPEASPRPAQGQGVSYYGMNLQPNIFTLNNPAAMPNPDDVNHLVRIDRLDTGVLAGIAAEAGMIIPQQSTSGLGIITETNE